MFAVRIVTADYYLASPVKDLDVCYSEFRESDVKKVPVVRIFGATPAERETSDGTWCWVIPGPPPFERRAVPLSSCTIVATEREREEGGPRFVQRTHEERGDYPLRVPSGPLALLQENSAVFQGRLRPCLKRMKEFGRRRKA
eukprot:superscaffoldBa00000242_g3059